METTKLWISLGTIVSPITGTFFTKIITQYNHKYLLWYHGEYLIKPGDNIKVNKNGIVISEKLRKINIIQIDKYSPTLWRVMHNMSSCPGDKEPENSFCTSSVRCIFKTCPYGKKRRNACKRWEWDSKSLYNRRPLLPRQNTALSFDDI